MWAERIPPLLSPCRSGVTGPLTEESQVGVRAAEQATDLADAAAHLRSERRDIDPGILALVSLDGGIGTATARASMEAVPDFHAAKARMPLLHFYETLDEYMAPDFRLLRTLPSAQRWTQRAALRHHLFTSLGAVAESHPALRQALGFTDESHGVYREILHQTLTFLDAFVKGDSTAQVRFVRPPGTSRLGPLEPLH